MKRESVFWLSSEYTAAEIEPAANPNQDKAVQEGGHLSVCKATVFLEKSL